MIDSFAQLIQRVRDGVDSGVERVRSALDRLHQDESGATLTEFVIMLPIFILVFNGVMVLGQFTRKGHEAPINAYKKTFENVLEFQTQQMKPMHMQTGLAAGMAGTQLYGSAKVHNISTAVKAVATTTESATYAGLGLRGHMGESYARANSAALVPGTKLQGCDSIGPAWPTDCTQLNQSSGPGALSTSNGLLTSDLEDLTGGSKYAKDLFYDGTNPSGFSGSSGGILGMLNAGLSAGGLRPVLAANIRYGTVYGESHDSYSFAGTTMDMDAHFSTLVPPTPKGAGLDAMVATAVTRTTMENHEQYKDLLGIGWDQPLSSESFSVPSYPQ